MAAAGTTRGDRTRARMLAFLADHPGSPVQAVATAVGLHRSSATYHLRVLQRAGRVAVRREGRFCVAFVAGTAACPVLSELGPRRGQAALRQALVVLAAHGGLAPRDLRRAGVPVAAARWLLHVLERAGALERGPRGLRALRPEHAACVRALATDTAAGAACAPRRVSGGGPRAGRRPAEGWSRPTRDGSWRPR